MSQKANEKVIGIFVLGAIILLIIIFVFFGSGVLLEDKSRFVVYFDESVNGLDVGAPVELRGVRIGQVRGVSLVVDRKGQFLAEVILETVGRSVRNLTPDLREASQEEMVDKLVASGMRAQLQMQSLLTGKLYISLEYFPDSQARFLGLSEDYVEIPSVVTKTEMLEEHVENILTTLSKMDLDTLTIMATRLVSTADSTLKTAEVERTLTAMRQTLKSTEIAFDRISKQIDPLAEGVIRTNEDIQSAIITLNELLRSLDQISLENRYQFSQTIQELRRATRTIRDLADQIERNPESIFFGKD